MKRKAIPKPVRKDVFDMYNGRCAYCGKPLTLKTMEVDHLIPLHEGGEDGPLNYVPACHSCNYYKCASDLEGFKRRLSNTLNILNKNVLYRLARAYGLINEVHSDGEDDKYSLMKAGPEDIEFLLDLNPSSRETYLEKYKNN